MGKVILTRWDEDPEMQRHEIVAGLFAAGEVALLTGKPKSGKSAVAVALAGAIVTGEPFLGRQVDQGDVVYFALERRQSVRRRIKALGLPPRSPIWTPRGTISIIEDADAIIEGIVDSRRVPKVVIFDTLARATTGLDENSARDMGVVAKAISLIIEALPETALVFVHHTTKDGDEARGSSALLGAVDLELRAKIHNGKRFLSVVHANDVPEDQRLDFQIEPVALPDGGTAIRVVPPSTAGQDAIMDRNAERRAGAQERARSALPHLPARPFTQAEAMRCWTQAAVVDGAEDTRKKQTKRMLDRLKDMNLIADQGGMFVLREVA